MQTITQRPHSNTWEDANNQNLRGTSVGAGGSVAGELIPLKRANAQRLELQTDRFVNHQTTAGETLSSISTRYYGKPDFYLDIYLANQKTMRHPGDLRPGLVLKIPVYE